LIQGSSVATTYSSLGCVNFGQIDHWVRDQANRSSLWFFHDVSSTLTFTDLLSVVAGSLSLFLRKSLLLL